MSLTWNKNNQAWRLPDSSGKGDGNSGAAGRSAQPNNGNDPNFEIDFTEGLESTPQEVTAPQEVSAQEVPAPLEVPALEVGSPGDFRSQQYDHGVRLNESTDAGSPSGSGSVALDALVMVDDPLPESMGGGNAAVQDMFVAEVLKGAQAFNVESNDSRPSALAGALLDLSVSSTADTAVLAVAEQLPVQETRSVSQNETMVFDVSSEAEKTIILPETRAEIENTDSQRKDSFQSTPSNSGLDVTLATAVQPFALQNQVLQPDSPRVSELLAQGSATIAKPEPKKPAGNAEKGKVTTEEKTKAGVAGKAADANTKEKAATPGKKTGSSAKGAAGATKVDAVVQPQTQLESTNKTPQASATFRQLPKDARIVLGTLVASIVISVSLFAVKQFRNSTEKSVNSVAANNPEQPNKLTPSSTPAANSKSAKPLQRSGDLPEEAESAEEIDSDVEKAGAESGQKSVPEKNLSTAVGAKDKKNSDIVADSEKDEDSEENSSEKNRGKKSDSYFALTRPTSRYAMDIKTLSPLFDASVALDRVQPRRVQNLLRQLPKSYAATDPVEKNAIREITGRYYLQVGALTKAMLLFSQSCPDPGKTSDVEICLHAARGMLLAGNTQELDETLELLRPRLTGKLAEWRDWLKLLDVSSQLSKPTLENFTQFTDEMIDKGPFMTSEWNLQLSGHFAKILMSVPHKLRIEYLKTITGNRKKMFEMRMAPAQFGLDIGSYMMPSILNLLLRYYELPTLLVQGEEPESDSEFSLMGWMFNVIAQSNMNEPRQTRARLAPLFGEKSFAPLARIIEGHLAAQAGDYQGAAAMISEQIGVVSEVVDPKADELNKDAQGKRFLVATQRLKEFPFLYVEWLFLGVKVASGLSDKELMKTVVLALEDARRRFPELKDEIQYWFMLGRGYRLLGYVAGVEAASKVTGQLATTPHELGFVVADKIWVLMQKRKVAEARALMRKSLREIAYHARLLELGAEFAAQWSEDPSSYLKLEQDIPKRYENRGRDRALLSFFTIRKLLSNY